MSLTAAAEADGFTVSFKEFCCFDKFKFRQFADPHPGDAVTAWDDEWLSAVIAEDRFDFFAKIGVDCTRGVGHGDVVFDCKSAAGTDLCFIAGG